MKNVPSTCSSVIVTASIYNCDISIILMAIASGWAGWVVV